MNFRRLDLHFLSSLFVVVDLCVCVFKTQVHDQHEWARPLLMGIGVDFCPFLSPNCSQLQMMWNHYAQSVPLCLEGEPGGLGLHPTWCPQLPVGLHPSWCPQRPVGLHPHLVPPAPSGSALSPGVPRAQCSDGQGASSQHLLATFSCITSLVTFLVYMLALAGCLCRCFSTKTAGLTHRDSFVCLPRE